jgi:hypothetical protein
MDMGISLPAIGPDAGSKCCRGQIGQSDGFAGQNERPMRTEVNNPLCDTHMHRDAVPPCWQIEAALSPHGTISA